jgi:hypothetical protein
LLLDKKNKEMLIPVFFSRRLAQKIHKAALIIKEIISRLAKMSILKLCKPIRSGSAKKSSIF